MQKVLLTILTPVLFLTAFSMVVLVADDDEIDIGKYEYVTRSDLEYYIRMEERIDQDRTREEAIQFKKFMDKNVNFCDELSIFWDELEDSSTADEAEDMESKGHIDDYSNQEFLRKTRDQEQYYKFETYNFRCVVPRKLADSVAYLRYVNKIKNERRLVMIWGRVEKIPLWAPVDSEYGAEEEGTRSEQVFIVCDKVARPRNRFFKEWKEEGK